MPRRLTQLFLGLALYGFSDGLLVRSELGLSPWDVFHQGLARVTGLRIGWWLIIVGIAVLLLWIPLRQRPGVGTICNALLIGLFLNATLDLVSVPDPMWARVAFLVVGVPLNALATAAYIGAALGPGPRDGLMTGIAARGHSIRVVRTCIEVIVLGFGFLLGGTVGAGTAIYAFTIGPLVHPLLPLMTVVPRLPEGGAELRAE
ncbi:MAG: hypothetical protein QOK42_1679 [Frankiaceae bacterium]|jgi:uncharacterized membrane protein YczE|nr:hypothetical protein [Frankiaceae bacterium]MDX6223831.1 hypothetical protein [Frankiales bacterium]